MVRQKMSMHIMENLYSNGVKFTPKCDVVRCKGIYSYMKNGRCYPGKFFVKGVDTSNLT